MKLFVYYERFKALPDKDFVNLSNLILAKYNAYNKIPGLDIWEKEWKEIIDKRKIREEMKAAMTPQKENSKRKLSRLVNALESSFYLVFMENRRG